MKKNEEIKCDTAVVVGRFQVDKLTEGHRALIDVARKAAKRVVIFIGVGPVELSTRNPLDYLTRHGMISWVYPSAVVLPILDNPNDAAWTRELDRQIHTVSHSDNVVIFTGRDGMGPVYNATGGRYLIECIDTQESVSGTDIRERIKHSLPTNSLEFRQGVIYGKMNLPSIGMACVDMAVFRDNNTKLLLGRKGNDTLLRFPGGFFDPEKDINLEAAASRELHEECGWNLETSKPFQYVCSDKVNNWRYRGEPHKIITTLFATEYTFGIAQAGDDLKEVNWYNVDEVDYKHLIPEHRDLYRNLLVRHLKKE